MKTSMQGIVNKARQDKKYRFKNLYTMINKELLLVAFSGMNKKAAAGIDKVTFKEYEENLNDNLNNLVDRLKNKTYRATMIKRVYIPKGNGKLRPLGIPSFEDKLLESAAAIILNSIYEQDFLPISYGYRPGVGAKVAVKDLTQCLFFSKVNFVVEADIKGFFDNLDHKILITLLEQRIDDKAFLRLIKKWLLAGILKPDNCIINPITGSPQGGIVSPILANIYLHYGLDLWFEKAIKPSCKGFAHICRYADDFVCLFQVESDAILFYDLLVNRLAKYKLKVAEEKTNILRFSKFSIVNSKRFDFLGFEFYWGTSKKGIKIIKRRTSRLKFRKALANFKDWIIKERSSGIVNIMASLNNKLRGYYNYYGIIGNSKSISSFHYFALKILFKWLNRRSQKKSFTLDQFYVMVNRTLFVKPKITESVDYQRKLCLSF